MQPDSLEFWIDLNLPAKMAEWLHDDFGVKARSFLNLGFLEVADVQVYKLAAQQVNTIIITTKDIDFLNYQNIVGAPPKILYLNIGNLSNQDLKQIIQQKFPAVLQYFTTTDQSFIEISTL